MAELNSFAVTERTSDSGTTDPENSTYRVCVRLLALFPTLQAQIVRDRLLRYSADNAAHARTVMERTAAGCRMGPCIKNQPRSQARRSGSRGLWQRPISSHSTGPAGRSRGDQKQSTTGGLLVLQGAEPAARTQVATMYTIDKRVASILLAGRAEGARRSALSSPPSLKLL